jgi:hypothetical protein
MPTAQLRKVLTLIVRIDKARLLGPCRDGLRSNNTILGGEFHGHDLRGEVLPGGADFFVERGDGIAHLSTRYSLLTDDGTLINLLNDGLLVLDATGQALLQDGCWPLPPQHYRCRCSPRFQVPRGRYEWLEQDLFIGHIEYLEADDLLINVYALDG